MRMSEEDAPVLLGTEESQPLLPEAQPTQTLKTYSSGLAFAIAVNYIVGTGCFGIPHGFVSAGLLLNGLVLVLGWLLLLITANYTLEFLARAWGLKHAASLPIPVFKLTFEKIDFSECASLFQGRLGSGVLQLYMTWYVVGVLWGYASMFGSSASLILGEFIDDAKCDIGSGSASDDCNLYFYVPMAVFAVIILILSAMDVGDQARVQSVLFGYKGVATALMAVTLILKLMADGFDAVSSRYRNIGLFNFSGFAVGFAPSILGLGAAYNLPDIIQPLQKKSEASFVVFWSFTICMLGYLLLGILGALSFDEVNPLVTLNWYEFTGCGKTGWSSCSDGSERSWIGALVQLIVLLYPVLNALAAFPLVCVTMGDNWKHLLPHKLHGIKWVSTLLRLVAAMLPVTLAFIFKKLDLIFIVSGLGGFLLNLIGPASLQLSSIRTCRKIWPDMIPGHLSWKTPYSKWLSSSFFAWPLLFFCVTLFIVAIVTSFV